ncbi:MAG: hypothetical protein ACD_47C00047G0005 [uncultured bacterium]|nr:MAG: hypothetical protein ACD_47C00047G0005 [uncultured bacterium]HBC74403.1 hypothetical protein [Candidatus Wallbacteria bacterium]
MMKKFKVFVFAFGALALIFWLNSGCSNDKLQLGVKEDEMYVSRIRTYRAGVETDSVAGIKVSEHLIIEGRAYNQNGTIASDSAVAMTTTDEKIAKILSVYRSKDSYYGVIRGENFGSVEILLTSGSVTVPFYLGVSTGTSGAQKPYIKFSSISTDPITVGSARQYNANYVDSNGAVSTSTALVWSLVPADEMVAKIASQTKDGAVVQGVSTGEVELLVKDAENTVASSVAIKVN